MSHSEAVTSLNHIPCVAPYGECAVRVFWDAEIRPDIHRQVRALHEELERRPFPGMLECVPSYAAVTVFYDPYTVWTARKQGDFGRDFSAEDPVYRTIVSLLEKRAAALDILAVSEPAVVEIPICYGGEYGPDLEEVARHAGMTPEEVVKVHASGEYLVYMLGFAPGFPYLGGMAESIAAPRRETPRSAIPAGSVGIAGKQTGIYPLSTPGGWQLIGRTPLPLFRPTEDPPSLLRAGDIIVFRPISRDEFRRLEQSGEYAVSEGASGAEASQAEISHGEERL
ncbi:5-oxoprolinase subunit PxpB [Saccharibacillus kuerlensis]|uniref:Kinase A inhibitor n=1 Tax=Saccharibacillus kuerlensis TaxID=459527 RepID=A0ABQ2L7I7_9BACL|nr:5-oxoprolinase subunit PxpB [Saccharibacillus kuerlensis]GGO04781.1 kinase A inhibitor [Saccharibacillus kuerlensis]